MAKSLKEHLPPAPPCGKMSCCKIEALISVDDRIHMVLPKEIRDRADIHTGDKLALVS